ncbi:hypothetical protein TVAG_276850 [Trichomonas vaginalis G3]|uniref:Uncharacterized protein n=1 Tax=Trichomonas vaginalis (strain ATCC PRA-98 / G3) TaxID=412133 RepID=A2FUE5_TRIV3|nr:hypothetical protein TVAGG3_0883890 [Trichomonas vaginalis G3]EAX91466.1 hypothetical protein TVAG_276850 [Trichomonas vaginalis G3]KAI5502246.1 hypothetical protein TVAGG3_0883890 [Trichomonas vaginalis G3]|eukprot:XP_001304396.1 hypothetical protein [Trichomonas vaginalis G3]
MKTEIKSLKERISVQNDIETELNKRRMQIFNQSYSIPVQTTLEMAASFKTSPNCNEKLAELDELNSQIYKLTVQIDRIHDQTAKYIFTPIHNDKKLISLQNEVSYLESRINQKKSFIEARKQAITKADISLQRISEDCYLLICKNEHQMYSLLLNELQSWKYINVKEELNTLMNWMGNLNLNLV